jgi:Ni/Fe-hydrogenase subunit HybB-like protein
MNKRKFILNRVKDVLWVVAFAGLVVGVGRFVFGLGASTNMLDSLPWGLWKIFNMVAGAALATSGFVVAAVIYILKLDRFRPVARLSVLIAFLGYGASLTALIFDIGLPHRGWHPFLMWNPHSFLFEVFWCVSIYWGVTALELLPIVTERFPYKKLTHFLHEMMLPFVVLGITLSTMHHSSLGSLFLMSPTRLHALWHTMWLPPEFFISAMGAGLSVIVLFWIVCSWLFDRERDMEVINALSLASGVILLGYLGMKVADLTVHDKWSFVFGADATWESRVFLVEIVLQTIVPLVIFFTPRLRRSIPFLIVATTSALAGIVMHRLDTGIVGYYRSAGQIYIPNLSEFILSFGVISAAGILFLFFVERFHIFDAPDEHDEEAPIDDSDGHGVEVRTWTRKEAISIITSSDAFRVVSIAIVTIPVTWFGLRHEATGPFRPTAQPVVQPIGLDVERTLLRIDGNGTAEFVDFPHGKHVTDMGGDASCIKCHHLNLPGDNSTSCHLCHSDMALDTDIFDHAAHQERHEDGDSCATCHDPDRPKGRSHDNAKACIECHRDNMNGLASQVVKGYSHVAPGYEHAMHGLCVTCHRLKEKDPADPKGLGNCLRCHPPGPREALKEREPAIEKTEPSTEGSAK